MNASRFLTVSTRPQSEPRIKKGSLDEDDGQTICTKEDETMVLMMQTLKDDNTNNINDNSNIAAVPEEHIAASHSQSENANIPDIAVIKYDPKANTPIIMPLEAPTNVTPPNQQESKTKLKAGTTAKDQQATKQKSEDPSTAQRTTASNHETTSQDSTRMMERIVITTTAASPHKMTPPPPYKDYTESSMTSSRTTSALHQDLEDLEQDTSKQFVTITNKTKVSFREVPRRSIMKTNDSTNSTCRSSPSLNGGHSRIHFDKVQVRHYPMELGDHPSCTIGAPIALSWTYQQDEPLDIDVYEFSHKPRRKLRHLVMSYYKRQDILRSMGYSEQELAQADRQRQKIQNQRNCTRLFLPLFKVQEALRSAGSCSCSNEAVIPMTSSSSPPSRTSPSVPLESS